VIVGKHRKAVGEARHVAAGVTLLAPERGAPDDLPFSMSLFYEWDT